MRFDIANSALASDIKGRLLRLAGNRVTADGVLMIEAKHFRTQEQNREDATQRFVDLIRRALIKPKPRKKTKPSAASKERRLKSKKVKGEIKKIRQSKSFE
jgi:ribosome-associated protein